MCFLKDPLITLEKYLFIPQYVMMRESTHLKKQKLLMVENGVLELEKDLTELKDRETG